ncbi:MAG: PD-(D/E)XK nuclease family protein [Nitrospirota bacterium]
MIYSHSRLETYRQCPQKFKFAYLDEVLSKQEGIEAFMGSRVHAALEKLYKDLKLGKPILSLDAVLAGYRQDWESEWHTQIQIVRDEMGPSEYFRLGEKCLTDYYHRYTPFNQSRTLGVEYPIKFSLDPEDRYVIQGYVDRLSMPKDGVLWIHDYKAKSNLPTQPELDADRQLAFYQIAAKTLWPEMKEVVLIWHYLLFDMEFHSRRTDADLAALRDETIFLIQEIETATKFPTKQSALCNWCEYRAICPLFKHLYETTPLPKSDYSKEAGVALVTRFAALKLEEDRIKDEMEALKEAMVSYAQQKKVEILYNKTHKVRVRVYENIKFPGKNDPGRAELESLVKESGVWEQVATLDTFVLSKKLLEANWSDDWVAQIKAKGLVGKTIWVKVSER